MATSGSDVVIIGGGIVGISTAYYLAKAGIRSVIVERDAVGSHASGFAYGGLSPLAGAGIPGPVSALAEEGMRLHRELAASLPEETGVNTEYRLRPSMTLAFTEDEAASARAGLSWQREREDFSVRWLDSAEMRSVEPRISEEAIGALLVEGGADVEPYRLSLAMAGAAERLGATIRHGNVTGLGRQGFKVTSVKLEGEELACDRVVVATGPWSGAAGAWLGVKIDVRPLKGQILRLRAPGAPFHCSVGWADNYATTKPDGLLWTGTTEEDVGFDETPTTAGRDSIMGSLLKMLPSLTEAQLVQQTACVRPLSSDGLPVLGPVDGWEGVYVATGAGRKGILLGPAMGLATADMIAKGAPDIPVEALGPGRFGGEEG